MAMSKALIRSQLDGIKRSIEAVPPNSRLQAAGRSSIVSYDTLLYSTKELIGSSDGLPAELRNGSFLDLLIGVELLIALLDSNDE